MFECLNFRFRTVGYYVVYLLVAFVVRISSVPRLSQRKLTNRSPRPSRRGEFPYFRTRRLIRFRIIRSPPKFAVVAPPRHTLY